MQSQILTLSWRTLRGLLCAACLAWASAGGIAGESHDRARKALEAGEVLPLRTILERVEREHPGQVIDVELERDHERGAAGGGGRWIYEIKLLRTNGALVKLKLDARDGTLITKTARDRRHDAAPPPLTPAASPKTPPASEAR
ncbi:MAG: PepSY domain-containing protein [Rhodoferax sp.]|nr:PepSY domain-containing protein [Rhodoferax sp.]MBK9234702.1 PepSY domain-containing protein [Rhodoferax sp.]